MPNYPKNILTINQLISKLAVEGMIISPTDNAFDTISTIGYYRFKGYSNIFFDTTNHKFFNNTNFSDIIKIYSFDMKLLNLLFGFISKIEVALRSRTTEALLQVHKDPLILSDPTIYKDKKLYWENNSIISSEISRSSEDSFIKHNYNNYNGMVPIWATVEIISFGTLSKIIKNLKSNSKECTLLRNNYRFIINSNSLLPSMDMLTSWVKSVSVLRNICAHNGRLYNRQMNVLPQILTIDKYTPTLHNHGLYAIILAMKYLRPNDDWWNEFVNDFNNLYSQYNTIIDLSKYDFPSDWANHFKV